MPPPARSTWARTKLAFALVALIGLLYVLWSHWDGAAMMAWKRDASPLWFFSALAILPAIGMPMTPFFVLAGTTFGIRQGLLGTIAAIAVNLIACYWIAHSGLRPLLARLLRRRGYDLPDYRQRSKEAMRFAIAIKFAPGLPSFAKNYALGMAGVPFSLYFWLSMLITGVYAVALIILGESMVEHDLGVAAVAVAGAVLLAIGIWRWRRAARS